MQLKNTGIITSGTTTIMPAERLRTIEYLYNEQEQPVRCEYYDADGTLTHYTTDEYDADGNRIACNIYDADGNLTGRDTYN